MLYQLKTARLLASVGYYTALIAWKYCFLNLVAVRRADTVYYALPNIDARMISRRAKGQDSQDNNIILASLVFGLPEYYPG